MGIELVNVLLLRYASALSGRAFKVLCRMASIALDQPNAKGQPARLYFAGEAPLAQVLYGSADGYSANQLREVRRVVAELVAAGLVERVDGTGRRGHRATFRLNLGLAVEGESAHPKQGESAHPKQGEPAHPKQGEPAHPKQGEFPPQEVGKRPTPRTHTGPMEESSQDSTPIPSAPTTGSTFGAVQPDDIEIAPTRPHTWKPDRYELDCLDCGQGRLHTLHTTARARRTAS